MNYVKQHIITFGHSSNNSISLPFSSTIRSVPIQVFSLDTPGKAPGTAAAQAPSRVSADIHISMSKHR
jgi:hypothetical protein